MTIKSAIGLYRKKLRHGILAILALAAIPNPFFDVAGVAAGILKMPLPRFLLAVWIGVTIKMGLFAWVGSTSLRWLIDYTSLMKNIKSFLTLNLLHKKAP